MNGETNFFKRYYDRILAGIAALALVGAGVYYFAGTGADGEAASAAALARIDRLKAAAAPVAQEDLGALAANLRQAKSPVLVTVPDEKGASFLASERRIRCRCGQVLVAGLESCPKCHASLVVINKEDEAAKRQARWATRFGVKVDDLDADGDGFTNREEFEAQTDPTDAKDHPNYVDSLKLALPLKETFVPFALIKATQIPSGWRCEFLDPKRRDDYGRLGRAFTAVIGEEIVIPLGQVKGQTKSEKTGYVLKSFTKKEEKRAITAGSTMQKAVDVSVATLKRVSDGKLVELVIQPNRAALRLTPVDVQATLIYERNGTKTFNVVAGDDINLNGTVYRVKGVKAVGKGAEVTLENVATHKTDVVKTLE